MRSTRVSTVINDQTLKLYVSTHAAAAAELGNTNVPHAILSLILPLVEEVNYAEAFTGSLPDRKILCARPSRSGRTVPPSRHTMGLFFSKPYHTKPDTDIDHGAHSSSWRDQTGAISKPEPSLFYSVHSYCELKLCEPKIIGDTTGSRAVPGERNAL